MTIFQKLLKFTYPYRMKFSEQTGLGRNAISSEEKQAPPVSFYRLSAVSNTGAIISFEAFKGRQVLIVNLASNCGFTGQYEELETLYQKHEDKLVILGFPANDFGGQEPGSDEEIATFCKVNYGVSFPLFKKGSVKGTEMQPVYQWLTDPEKNGWNGTAPAWNFCKYLVNEEGILTNYFSSAVSPLSSEITNQLS